MTLATGFLACVVARIVAGDSNGDAIAVALRHLAGMPAHQECLGARPSCARP
jgi:hypothetical protein